MKKIKSYFKWLGINPFKETQNFWGTLYVLPFSFMLHKNCVRNYEYRKMICEIVPPRMIARLRRAASTAIIIARQIDNVDNTVRQ